MGRSNLIFDMRLHLGDSKSCDARAINGELCLVEMAIVVLLYKLILLL